MDLIKARKQGGTVVLSLTGYIEPNEYYSVKKEDDGTIIIKKPEIIIK